MSAIRNERRTVLLDESGRLHLIYLLWRCSDTYVGNRKGVFREVNLGPLMPETGIIPLDQVVN